MKLLMVLVLLVSCSSASMRRLEERSYHLCSPKEVENPVGKACHRYPKNCSKKGTIFKKKCKLHVIDLNDPKMHERLMNAGFRLKAIRSN